MAAVHFEQVQRFILAKKYFGVCGTLKKETEGLILAAQEQALRTNSIKTSETPL